MRNLAKLAACVGVVLLFAAPAAAKIGVSVDVLWNPDPHDDAQVFLHVTNMAFPQPRERVVAVFHELPYPYDDFPVLAFIATHGRVDIGTVWAYKKRGHDWFNVMLHFGVRPSLLFMDVGPPPGPPYGRAYGYWKKHGDRIKPEHLTNEDIRYWVSVRALSAYAAVPPARVVEWRGSGKRFNQIAAYQYREKHPKGPKEARGPKAKETVDEAELGPSKGRGKAKSRGRGDH